MKHSCEVRRAFLWAEIIFCAGLCVASHVHAVDLETSFFQGFLGGSFELRTPVRFELDTAKELPSLLARLRCDGSFGEHLAIHSILEAGYDGAARNPKNDRLLLGFDNVYPSTDRYVQVPEAYVTLVFPSLDVRFGIQKFSWGNLSPLDLRHLFDVSSSMDRKIGVPALRVSYLCSMIETTVEAIWIPFFVPYRLPDPEDRWYPQLLRTPETVVIPPSVVGITLPPVAISQHNDEARLPSKTMGHSEFGLRISRTIGSLDLGVSYFNGYDRMPVVTGQGTVISAFQLMPPALSLSYDFHILPFFHRMHVYGVDMAYSLSNITLRAEGAYTRGRYFNVGLNALSDILEEFTLPQASDITTSPLQNGLCLHFPFSPRLAYQKDFLSLGAGIDYQWGNHLLTFQTLGNQILGYHGEPLVYEEFEFILLVGLHSRFLEDTLQAEAGLVINPMQEFVLTRTELTYAVTDQFSLAAQLLLLNGKAESPFGQFRRNDQVSVTFKYSF